MKKQGGFVAVFLLLMVVCALLGAFLWPYTINSWLEFFGKPPVVVWWHGMLLGFTPWLGYLTVPAAVVTFVLMLILV